MDCNKEAAIKAKSIATRKMEMRDFVEARRLAMKAQQLYADLENISQMLTVCEVHCAANQSLLGNEMDWYCILQVERTADEGTIKKQYKKFALQLHPDKNKFPGAEAAFKLIGEAQKVLLDKVKRSLHDVKRKATTHKAVRPYWSQQKATHSNYFGVQNNFGGNFMGVNLQHRQQKQQSATGSGFHDGRQTFWTICPFCNRRYLYYIEFIDRTLHCKYCSKPFVAHPEQGAPTASNFNQTAFPQRKDVPNQDDFKVKVRGQGDLSADHSKTESVVKKECASEKVSRKVNGKRRRNLEEDPSERCNNGCSSDRVEETPIHDDVDFSAEVNLECCSEQPRRSARHKQHVSCKENLSDKYVDADSASFVKNAIEISALNAAEDRSMNGSKEDSLNKKEPSGTTDVLDQKEMKQKDGRQRKIAGASINSYSSSNTRCSSDLELYVFPVAEFHDFDSERDEDRFAIGQMWAVYDTLNAMPRFYAQIKKVFSSGFKLQIAWLEPDSDDEDEIKWVDDDLPVACGKFKLGDSENTEDHLMFSHLVQWEKGNGRNTCKIFPRKGETWALFKNWDLIRKTNAASRKYEYEYVEMASEYSEASGALVASLVKVDGFTSLFRRASEGTNSTFQIPRNQLFRFSHKVPSFKLTGEQRSGVPAGCLELDPASMPYEC